MRSRLSEDISVSEEMPYQSRTEVHQNPKVDKAERQMGLRHLRPNTVQEDGTLLLLSWFVNP